MYVCVNSSRVSSTILRRLRGGSDFFEADWCLFVSEMVAVTGITVLFLNEIIGY